MASRHRPEAGRRAAGRHRRRARLQFAVNTYGERAHPNCPAQFNVPIAPGGDGGEDFVIFVAELGGFGVTGRNDVRVLDVATGEANTFFTDAGLDSAHAILTVPLQAVASTPASRFDFQ